MTGSVVTSAVDVAPAWAALAGCVAMLVPRLRRRDVDPGRLLGEMNLGFAVFVLALAVVVDGVTRHGLGATLSHLMPHGTSLLGLIEAAFVAALLANVLNNLPATLLLFGLLATPPILLAATICLWLAVHVVGV